MPSVHVFPGGLWEVSDGDEDWGQSVDEGIDVHRKFSSVAGQTVPEFSLKIAALRELLEETNLRLVPRGAGDATADSEWRTRVQKDHHQYRKMFEAREQKAPIGQLQPWARWVTPEQEKYRYDTSFFLALLDERHQLAGVKQDNQETIGLDWMTPSQAIADFAQKKIKLAPPTWLTLLQLSQHSFADLESRAKRMPSICDIEPIQPKFRAEDGAFSILLPGDPDYDERGSTTRNRIIMRDGDLEYDNHPVSRL